METLSSRLAKARTSRTPKLSQEALADMLAAKQSSVASWERGTREPDLETIGKLAHALQCAPEWLAFGVQPINSNDMVILGEYMIGEIKSQKELGLISKNQGTPMLNRYIFPKTEFQNIFGRAADGVIVFEVKGDGMLGTYNPGEKVLVDLSDKSPSPPGTFLLWDGLTLVVRRLEFVPHSSPARVRITYDNRSYESYESLADEAFIQGRVIGSWQRR